MFLLKKIFLALFSITMILILSLIFIIKSLNKFITIDLANFVKCGYFIRKIDILNNNLILNKKTRCEEIVPIKNINKVIYKKGFFFYFDIYYMSDQGNIVLGEDYHVSNSKKLVEKLGDQKIPLIPKMGSSDDVMHGDIVNYCRNKKKYLLYIEGKDKNYCVYNISKKEGFVLERGFKKVNNIEALDICSALQNPTHFFNQQIDERPIESNFIIIVLDESLSLHRGFMIIPVLSPNILYDEIAFGNENEIKRKISELFLKYDKDNELVHRRMIVFPNLSPFALSYGNGEMGKEKE